MNTKQLINLWESQAAGPKADESFSIKLPLGDVAKIMALSEMFPGRTQEQIITELLAASLNEIEEGFPYKQGTKVISTDDHGDPIYEDIGHTPLFEQLIKKNIQKLRDKQEP